jgi:hypothetical protein
MKRGDSRQMTIAKKIALITGGKIHKEERETPLSALGKRQRARHRRCAHRRLIGDRGSARVQMRERQKARQRQENRFLAADATSEESRHAFGQLAPTPIRPIRVLGSTQPHAQPPRVAHNYSPKAHNRREPAARILELELGTRHPGGIPSYPMHHRKRA